MPAAIGLAQLGLADEFIRNRQEYCRIYDRAFGGLEKAGHVRLFDTAWKDVAPYIYVLRLRDGSRRQALIQHLNEHGVASGIHFLGAHEFSFYAASRRGPLTVTEAATEEVLTLPLHPYMDDATLERVITAVNTFFGAAG